MNNKGVFRRLSRHSILLIILLSWIVLLIPVSVVKADAVVAFPDKNLEAAVRQKVGKPTGDIYQSDLIGLTSLSAPSSGISSLSGLEHCSSLTQLDLGTNELSDITPLSGLTSLITLNLRWNQIGDHLSPLSALTNLTILDVSGDRVRDISPLSGLTKLTCLRLGTNEITSISPLSGLTGLRNLNLDWNCISDISPLSSLANLDSVSLDGSPIADISPLSSLTSLTSLSLSATRIDDISPLSSLTNLSVLFLNEDRISDISPLSTLTGLRTLYLDKNQVTEISSLSVLRSLTALNLGGNQIGDISPISSLTGLTSLLLADSQLGDISFLSNLANLDYLGLWGNRITDISSLSGLTKLKNVFLQKNQISDIEPLVRNPGIASRDIVHLEGNPLSSASVTTWIPSLQTRGVRVYWDTVVQPPSSTEHDLSGIWGSSSSNIFAVGDSGTILHYGGTAWSAMTSGTTSNLRDVWGSSASDIYAVGDGGTILHYDGSSWKSMPSGTTNNLNGIWGSSPSDVYAVGDSGTILRYDGSNWGAMESGTVSNLQDISGSVRQEILTMGDNRIMMPSVAAFAVGDNGTVLYNVGLLWEPAASGTTADLYGVWTNHYSRICVTYAVGERGEIIRRVDPFSDLDANPPESIPSGTTNRLLAIWGNPSLDVVNDLYAVGAGGALLHFCDNGWSSVASGSSADLHGAWGSSPCDLFAVGDSGTILHPFEVAQTPFSACPYGYKFPNAHTISDCPYTHEDEGISDDSKWEIFRSTFDLEGVDYLAQLFWFSRSDFGSEGNCYGMAASSLMQYEYPAYDNVVESLGELFVSSLGQPETTVWYTPTMEWGDSGWDTSGDIDGKPLLRHIIEFQISWPGVPDDARIVGTKKVLDALRTGLPNTGYVLNIFDNGEGHAVVPLRVETVKEDQEYELFINDSNYPCATKSMTFKKNSSGGWGWEYETWSGPSWWGRITGDTSINVVPISALYNGGRRLRLPGTGDAREAAISLSGSANLIISDADGWRAGLCEGQFVEDITDVRLVLPCGDSSGNEAAVWEPLFLIDGDKALRYAIEPTTGSREHFTLAKLANKYLVQFTGSVESQPVNVHISEDGQTLTITGQDGVYSLLLHNSTADGITFNATDIPSTPSSVHEYTVDWDALSKGKSGITLRVDADGDGDFETTIKADEELTADEFASPGNSGGIPVWVWIAVGVGAGVIAAASGFLVWRLKARGGVRGAVSQ